MLLNKCCGSKISLRLFFEKNELMCNNKYFDNPLSYEHFFSQIMLKSYELLATYLLVRCLVMLWRIENMDSSPTT